MDDGPQAKAFSIQVDDRERGGPVLELLRQSAGFRVTVSRLKLGDYLLDSRFVFERKTLKDLVAAIIDGRLFQQALRLSATKLQPALILEGTAQDFGGCGMRWEAIQGALVTVSLFCGVPLLRARTPAVCGPAGPDDFHRRAATPRLPPARKTRPAAFHSPGPSGNRPREGAPAAGALWQR
jgi:ERCC4-type nuclease